MNTYLLFKSLHLIAVISWMAGLLYLPRIFVIILKTAISQLCQMYLRLWKENFFFIL